MRIIEGRKLNEKQKAFCSIVDPEYDFDSGSLWNNVSVILTFSGANT